MAEFPALPLFTDAYLADTRHLSTAQHGAYLLLLITAWRTQDGTLPDDDAILARYAGLSPDRWAKMSPIIREFFQAEDGRLVQLRLLDEREHAAKFRDRMSALGKASAAKRAGRHKPGKRKASIENGISLDNSENPGSDPKSLKSNGTDPAHVATHVEHPNPNPLREESNDSSIPPTPFAVPQPEWSHFVEHRKTLRKPLSPHAVKLAVATLDRLSKEGHDPKQVLEQSILNGWVGLFPVDGERHARPRSDKPSGWAFAGPR